VCDSLNLLFWVAATPRGLSFSLHKQSIALLLLLPQVLEKLDEEGCACVASLLKGLPYSSVFVVGQANSFVTKEFASVDTVVKEGGCSSVEIGAVLA
jgi:hypothetical protein